MADKIRQSNGSAYYFKSNRNIAIVADEFLHKYYQDAVNLHYVTPTNYVDILCNGIDAFLVVSSWRGLAHEWVGISRSTSNQGQKLIEVMEYARGMGIKVVFRNIEDPPDYQIFLPYAKAADIIFTSASEMIARYKEDTGNDNVFPMLFGVNPMLHNPIGIRRRASLKLADIKDTVFLQGAGMPSSKTDVMIQNYYLMESKMPIKSYF